MVGRESPDLFSGAMGRLGKPALESKFGTVHASLAGPGMSTKGGLMMLRVLRAVKAVAFIAKIVDDGSTGEEERIGASEYITPQPTNLPGSVTTPDGWDIDLHRKLVIVDRHYRQVAGPGCHCSMHERTDCRVTYA